MRKEVYFDAGPMSPFWQLDCQTPYHVRFTARLDHEVDPHILSDAWECTKQVYPLIDCVPARRGDNMVFYRSNTPNPPIESTEPVRPGSALAGGRAFVLSYHGDRITLGSYHSVSDGGGAHKVCCTLLHFYLERRFGATSAPLPATVDVRTGRRPEEYYMPLSNVAFDDFEHQPLVTYPKRAGMFCDYGMAPDEQGNIYIARLKAPVASFMAACKKIGANPSTMMAIVLGRAAWRLHPERTGDIAFALTMSTRPVFGIDASIANCSTNLLVPVRRDEVLGDDLASAAHEIRSITTYQRTPEFLMTLASFYQTYDWILARRYAVLTYIGTLDVGEHTPHIRSIHISDDATSTFNLVALNGEFVLSLMLGSVTGAYQEAIKNVLAELGVSCTVDAPSYCVAREVDVLDKT